jgi:predicted dehydrogenase
VSDVLRVALAGLHHAHIEMVLEEIAWRPDRIELVAIAEPDRAVRERFRSRLGVPAYADHREMLERERPDAVGVAAVNAQRGPIIVDALRAGAHIVADKPLCTTLEHLAAIERAAREQRRVVHCLLEKRLWPETLAADEVLAAGELGDLVLASASAPHRLRRQSRPGWMFEREAYGGVLNDLAIHDIDLLLHFSGASSGWVQGWSGNRANADRPGFEDYGVVLLRTDTGLVATAEVHWLSSEAAPYHGDYRIVLTGTMGTAELRYGRGGVTVATHQRPPRELQLPAPYPAARDFFDAVLGGTSPRITTDEVVAATRVVITAQTHSNEGTWEPWGQAKSPGSTSAR